jgi:hypothetical protein
MSQENVEVVRRVYEFLDQRDVADLLAGAEERFGRPIASRGTRG